jgi:hypothetical protein
VKNPSQQQAPPAPKSADSGPSLEATMKFIQDKLNSIGPVKFVALTHDGETGDNWKNWHMEEDSKVNADTAACIVNFHFKEVLGGTVRQDKHAWIPLKAVHDITVLPEQQYLNELDSANGHPLRNSRVDPPVFVVKVTGLSSNDYSALVFLNEDLASRVAKAMVHAVELCGGGNKGRF